METIAGSVTQLALALGGLWAVTRLVISVQFRMLNNAYDREAVLELRIDKLEADREIERDAHHQCREELHEHKLESSAQIAALQTSVEHLTLHVNRSHRHNDPEGA